ncbi:response regulator [Ancylomarina sp. 16SWW S1-10-2]|uniref:response regulator n=1 Tax=Ancylomarina sp. 16SWW S1-10-2 TaxID=2499681 RepID=UPI0012AD4B61|nr:response regulator [Ancylomarina sp. 16SWW S1-10-2]MRT94297.1 response regulator [Ancylomarina sp. 16SWW S1-10-2]
MKETVKILLLEDNIYDAELIHHQILKSSIKHQFKHVFEFDDFMETIDDYIPDIILSDYNLVGFTGLDALEFAKQKCPLTPFIIVTGTIDEETAAETIKKGAWDYVVKERLTRLDSAMKKALQLKEEIEKSAINREKLKISEERFKLAIEGSQDGIWDWDLKSNEIYLSSRWKSMLGYEDHEIENNYSSWESLLHPDDKELTIAALGNHLKKETPFYKAEFRLKCKNGQYKWIFARGKAIYDKNNKPYRVAGSQTDISEQKLMEIRLIKAKEKAEESDRLKTAFLSNMSHEIRTPMNGILGFAGLLKEPKLESYKQKEFIELIEKSGLRMLNIINDIIDISKIEAGLMKIDKKYSNVNEQIEYIDTFFKPEAEEKGLKLTFKNTLPTDEAVIFTDREKVFAIITNLVKNAIKYTNKGSIEFGYNRKETQLEFYVKDTGIGIQKDRLVAIFERFIQADIMDKMALQGAGLGLTITKSYVEMLGGTIWVESKEGLGSTFYFTLPYDTEKNEKHHTNNEIILDQEECTILPKSLDLKILIAEDDETSASLLTIISKKFSHKIIKTINGIETVEACRNNPDIDLILMDIKMQKMDGYKATKQIREFNKNVIIIAQTAYGLSGDKEKAIESGCNDYLSKPINSKILLTLIKKHFYKG